MRALTPREHAVVAAAAHVPWIVYELVEVRQGPDGWPYSRYARLVPFAIGLGAVVAFNVWFVPHIWRQTGAPS